MSTNTPSSTDTQTKPEKVYVEIPRAKPGQGYKAPKNYDTPALTALSKLAVLGACASLPLAPALIFAMILINSQESRDNFLALWLIMIVFIETIAIFVAIGLAREALGVGYKADYDAPVREVSK